MKGFELFVARRYLWAQRKNLSAGIISLFSAAGVMIGTWLLIFVLSAINGFEHEVKRQLIGKDAHFELTKYRYEPISDYDSLLRYVREFPQVTAASPYIMTKTIIQRKRNSDGIVVFGIDPASAREVIDLDSSLKNGLFHLGRVADSSGPGNHGIILGHALASRLGADVGDKVLLADFSGAGFETGDIAPRRALFVVTGTFESGMYQFDETLAYISLEAAQDFFGMQDQVTGIQAKVKDPYLSAIVSEKLETSLGYPFRAVDWQAKNSTLIKWMSYEKVLVGLALGIIIIIAAFNIISSLVMAVTDKKREIGILRAMGATRTSILRVFVLQGTLIGIFGSLAGLVLGLLSYWLQLRFGFIQLPGDVYFVTTLPVRLQIQDVAAVLVLTNVLCSISTVLPALKAARQDPVEAIHHE